MNDTFTPPALPNKRGFLKPVVATTCIVGALLGVLFLKNEETPSTSSIKAQEKSGITLLERLPQPDSTTLSGKSLEAAISNTLKFPEAAGNWVKLGDSLAQVQRDCGESAYFDFAEIAYREALRLDANTLAAMSGMAWVTGGRHEFDKSIEWGKSALTLDPQCVEAHGILGDAAMELGNYDTAYDHYQKMMDLRPDLSSWSRGAHLLWVTGNPSKALWMMDKAIRSGGPYAENAAWCRARMATMHFQNGALIPAQKVIQPSLDAGTKNPHVLLIAAKIAAANREFGKAADLYQQMLTIRPNIEALAGLGDLMTAQGRSIQAENYYKKVEALHEDHLKSGVHDHSFMAKFLADRQRNLVEALRMAEEHKLTKNVQEADTLAWVYFKNGHLQRAISTMKYALSQNTPDAEMHYHAGLIAAAHGDQVAARKHLQTALTINPHFSLIQAPLAVLALQTLGENSDLSVSIPSQKVSK